MLICNIFLIFAVRSTAHATAAAQRATAGSLIRDVLANEPRVNPGLRRGTRGSPRVDCAAEYYHLLS